MRKIIAATLLVALLALGFIACGDDDNAGNGGGTEITTQKGLAVALAAQAGDTARDRSTSAAAEGDLSPQAPSTEKNAETAADAAKSALQQAQAAGLTVTGYGLASAEADSAIVEFYFSSNYRYDTPVPDTGTGSSGGGTDNGQETPSTPTTSSPIAEADLQAVIDAVIAAGVSADDIEFLAGSYYDPYYASATLRVTVRDLGNVGNVIDVATAAAAGLTGIYLNGTYVSYTLSDCAALQAAALQAAVEDAATQGDALASAVGVGRGAIIAASSYSYSAYGGTSCDVGGISPYPMGGVAYAEGQAQQVQVYATVTVTYAMS